MGVYVLNWSQMERLKWKPIKQNDGSKKGLGHKGRGGLSENIYSISNMVKNIHQLTLFERHLSS